MFDIEKELNEVRSINVSPSKELIDTTTEAVREKIYALKENNAKIRQSNIIKLSGFAAIPAAACVLLAVVIGSLSPHAAAYYTVDINQSIVMSVDESGYVIDVHEELDILDENKLDNQTIEYAISQAIAATRQNGYITDGDNILIGCFGDDKYNNISRNQILNYIEDLTPNIKLLSIHGSMRDWIKAKDADIPAGLYYLALLSDITVTDSDITLNGLINRIEETTGSDIATVLAAYAEPVNYTAPQLEYYINDNYINIYWDYIDYKSLNYDGDITYNLLCADSESALVSAPEVLDIYTFTSWDKQPVSYTLAYDKKYRNKYYAIAAIYDDKTIVLLDEYIYVP